MLVPEPEVGVGAVDAGGVLLAPLGAVGVVGAVGVDGAVGADSAGGEKSAKTAFTTTVPDPPDPGADSAMATPWLDGPVPAVPPASTTDPRGTVGVLGPGGGTPGPPVPRPG